MYTNQTPRPPAVLGTLVLAVPGAWGYRAFFEVVLAGLSLVVFAAAGSVLGRQAVVAAVPVLAGLVFTRKMLVLDTQTRRAQGASIARWFAQGPPIPFESLRPWVHRTQETHRTRRQGGSVSTSRFVRSILHLTATDRGLAQSTSAFHGFDRFATIVTAFVGAPVDPGVLAAALAAERTRLWTRAILSTLLAVALAALGLVAIAQDASAAVLTPALLFLALSAARWWTLFTDTELRARALPLGPRRSASAAAHGAALLAVLALVPAMFAVRDAHHADFRVRHEQGVADRAAAVERTIAERPARGRVAPVVASLPARADGAADAASVRARLEGVGFSVSSYGGDNSAFTWQLHARPADALTVDLSLRPAHASDSDGQLVGAAWVSVRSPDPAARAGVLRFIAQRQDTTEATLGAALRSVGVPGITARAGSAWGYVARREYSVVAVALDAQEPMLARACTVAAEGLLCAEINRTLYRRADPNWARYALVTAASAR